MYQSLLPCHSVPLRRGKRHCPLLLRFGQRECVTACVHMFLWKKYLAQELRGPLTSVSIAPRAPTPLTQCTVHTWFPPRGRGAALWPVSLQPWTTHAGTPDAGTALVTAASSGPIMAGTGEELGALGMSERMNE